MPDLRPVPDPPDPVALARAERARRNGARSRGPVTAISKARSARNALKHGLRARLTVPTEDEAAFRGMAERLFAELAPAGELEGFLVADLAAAMWRTGRARRFEADALAGERPDANRLELALRYQASASRDLFRLLRALQNLPPAVNGRPRGRAGPGGRTSGRARLGRGCRGPAPVAARRLPPPAPCPRQGAAFLWHWCQEQAFPGAEPVPVDADGTVYALEEGKWVPRAWPLSAATPPRPNEPSQAVDPPAIPQEPTGVPEQTPRHGLAPLGAEAEPAPGSFERLWGLARPVRSAAGAPDGG